MSGYAGEKIRVRLASNTLSILQSDFKVKIDDIKKKIDVNVNRRKGISVAVAKEAVNIFVQIPTLYIGKIKCAVNAEMVEVHSLECDSIEFDTKTPNVILEDVTGMVEINCNLDMEVVCHSLNGAVAINQVSAASKIYIPESVRFTALAKGIGTSICYEKDRKQTDCFSVPDADNIIELNGIKSELVICTYKEGSLASLIFHTLPVIMWIIRNLLAWSPTLLLLLHNCVECELITLFVILRENRLRGSITPPFYLFSTNLLR